MNSSRALGEQAWAKHLRAVPGLDSTSAVLDFGCGYFDVGIAIADRVGRVDGFDIEERTLAVARARAQPWPNSQFFSSSDAIPPGTYDLIVANSVFQYLDNDDQVLRTLQLFRSLLNPHGLGEVLIGDLTSRPPIRPSKMPFAPSGSRSGDLTADGRPSHKAAFKSVGLPPRDAPDRLRELAAAAGFHCDRLPVNVTPSRQRYSCRLLANDRPAAGLPAGRLVA